MKRLLTLAAAIAATTCALTAQADIINASFTGTVDSGNAYAAGSTLDGAFAYSTDTHSYLYFNIGAYSVAPGYSSSALITPDQYDALYEASLSTIGTTSPINSAFTLDLAGLNHWSSAVSAEALLTDASQLPGNLDTTGGPFSSQFKFYIGNADGTNISESVVFLKGLTVTAVPLPPSGVLMLVGALAFGGLRKRSR